MSDSSPPPSSSSPSSSSGRPPSRVQPWSIWIIVFLLLGGVIVAWNYVIMTRQQAAKQMSGEGRPYFVAKLESNRPFVDSNGDPVVLKDFQGKVWIASQVFTRCPGQCAGVGFVLNQIQKEFRSDPRFAIVSASMDPAYDTPATMKQFRETHKLDGDNWWFLTGEPDSVYAFLKNDLKFTVSEKPEADRQSENDLYDHDTRLALIDGGANIRGWYDAFDDNAMAKLRRDLKSVLGEKPIERSHAVILAATLIAGFIILLVVVIGIRQRLKSA